MTRIEYDLLRAQEPRLRLPDFGMLLPDSVERVHQYSREKLIGARAATLLA